MADYEVEFTDQNVFPAFIALITAARNNQSMKFDQHLRRMENVNVAIDNRGNTILHAMVSLPKREYVRSVLARGAVFMINHRHQTALHLAIRREAAFLVNTLLDGCTPETLPTVVAAADELGNTALHVAAFKGDVMVVRALLDRRAPLLLANQDGKIPFELADFRSPVGLELQLHTGRLNLGPIMPELKSRLPPRV